MAASRRRAEIILVPSNGRSLLLSLTRTMISNPGTVDRAVKDAIAVPLILLVDDRFYLSMIITSLTLNPRSQASCFLSGDQAYAKICWSRKLVTGFVAPVSIS